MPAAVTTITWQAFSSPERPAVSATATVFYPEEFSARDACEALFAATNTGGALYGELLEYFGELPAGRTHTSLSVGDTVTLNGMTFLCAFLGWQQVKFSTEKGE